MGKPQEPVETLGQGRFLRLIRDGRWEYVCRNNGPHVVAVLGATDAGNVLLIEQFRHPVGAVVIEFPAGLIGDDAASTDDVFHPATSITVNADAILESAGRELEEETGFRAATLRLLSHGPSSAGLTNEMVHFVLAEGLSRAGDGGGIEQERITVHQIPFERVDSFLTQAVAAGKVIDPRVLAGLYLLERSRRGEASFAGA